MTMARSSKVLEADFYFANPCGELNEHSNELFRQYLLKEEKLLDVTKKELAMI
jgi:IS30 family transposase